MKLFEVKKKPTLDKTCDTVPLSSTKKWSLVCDWQLCGSVFHQQANFSYKNTKPGQIIWSISFRFSITTYFRKETNQQRKQSEHLYACVSACFGKKKKGKQRLFVSIFLFLAFAFTSTGVFSFSFSIQRVETVLKLDCSNLKGQCHEIFNLWLW